jgi:hypothetical protein
MTFSLYRDYPTSGRSHVAERTKILRLELEIVRIGR